MKRKITSIKWGILPLFIFLNNVVIAQKFINNEFYWPPQAPNGVTRNTGDETAEDWWYDIKAVPSTHAAYTDGKFIACGYSSFDEVGLQNVITNDPCYQFVGNDLSEPSPENIREEFELKDMKHLNGGNGTIGLINITASHSANENPYSWIYSYGLGSTFSKVIPTADGGFLATGICEALKTTGPLAPIYDSNLPDIRYQAPLSTPSTPNQFDFTASCNVPDNPDEWNDPNAPPARHRHACLLKVDRLGRILWYYKYGIVPFNNNVNNGLQAYYNGSYGTDVAEVSDGYIMTGGLSNFQGALANSPGNKNYGGVSFLAKISFAGSLIWIKEFKENSPYVVNRFTGIKTKKINGVVYAYVTGERTKIKIGDISSDPRYNSKNLGSLYWNSKYDPSAIQERDVIYEPFVRKINLSTQTEVWQLGVTDLSNDLTLNHRCRNIVIDAAGNLLVSVSYSCILNSAKGECLKNVIYKIVDNSTSASVIQTTDFGPLRAYDLERGLAVCAVGTAASAGFIVVGTKKAYGLNIEQNYSVAPFGLGYNMLNNGNTDTYAQTDVFVAKCNASGLIEWTTIFDNSSVSPGGNYLTSAGNPMNQVNINSWMNITAARSKKDIKRQECLYAITTSPSPEGNVIVAGNMSSNIDDSYVGMIQNTCLLDLSNHLIQSVPSIVTPGSNITMMKSFIASSISTGKSPGSSNSIAQFVVNNKAQTVLEAGQVIDMYEGTDLGFANLVTTPAAISEADVDVRINPAHTCTSGPLYQYNVPAGNANGTAGRPQAVVSANTKISNENISIYPNPANGNFILSFSSIEPGNLFLELFNMTGEILKKIKITNSTPGKQVIKNIDITDLPPGTYIGRISIGNTLRQIKLIKQNR